MTWLLFNVVIVYGLLLNHVPKSISVFLDRHIYIWILLLAIYAGVSFLVWRDIAFNLSTKILWGLTSLLAVIFVIKAIHDFNHI